MKDSELMRAIEAYTKSHKRMPTRVRGAFSAFDGIGALAAYVENPHPAYWTPLGTLSLELDADASDFYVC